MARRPPGAVVQALAAAGVRSLAPGQLHDLQRTLGNHQLGELLRPAYGMASPVEQSARSGMQASLGQDFSTVPAHTGEAAASRSATETIAGSLRGADAANRRQGRELAPPIVHAVLRSSGEPLEPGTRAVFESRFAKDLSHVRVHRDVDAARSVEAVGADAYTVGHHVVFGSGRYDVASVKGQRLIAHELRHVAQAGPPLSLRPPADLEVARPDDHEEREASSASWPLTSSTRYVLRRQVARATDRERRASVEEMIRFLQRSQAFYADPKVPVDQARVSRVLDGWYTAVTAQEQIARGLGGGGDSLLVRELKAAYVAALATLLGRAAVLTKRPVSELHGINRGRIPMWAWQEPSHLLPGFSTPVPEGRAVDVTGSVIVPTQGVSVSILPDAADPKLGDRAETRIQLRWATPKFHWTTQGKVHVVTAMDPLQTPTATIQTFFGPEVRPASRSGYGRGTTPEDVAGAAVDPRIMTVGFHEGQHGMDYVEFLRTHAPPQFGGHVGMTQQQFQAAGQRWSAAMKAYEKQARAFSTARTDCVGVTIDEFEQGRAAGRKIKLVCPLRKRP
jgi:hypothetical protein